MQVWGRVGSLFVGVATRGEGVACGVRVGGIDVGLSQHQTGTGGYNTRVL